jgi:hypothetical protein
MLLGVPPADAGIPICGFRGALAGNEAAGAVLKIDSIK